MFENAKPYILNNELNIAQIIEHFDSNYLFDILDDRLSHNLYNYSSYNSLMGNMVASFESNFKVMRAQYEGDSENINIVREETYNDIIKILCKRFNLDFNTVDDSIDKYTAAYYLYEILVCKFNDIMINFFTSFIVNNKDSLYATLNLEQYKKSKDSSSIYNKKVYDDQKFAIISANIPQVINYIASLDVRLVNIFQSTYKEPQLVAFLDNAFRDRGNFFKDFYCAYILKSDVLPVAITNIKLQLQRLVGSISNIDIETILASTTA